MASLTTTINTIFGSRLVGNKSGVVLNNEMDDFVARPGVPNHYGLIGSKSNAVAPGAVPLSKYEPHLADLTGWHQANCCWCEWRAVYYYFNASGIINIIDFGMDPSDAVSVPRIHHQWAPRKLFADSGIPKDVLTALNDKGHQTEQMEFYSSVQVVMKNQGELPVRQTQEKAVGLQDLPNLKLIGVYPNRQSHLRCLGRQLGPQALSRFH